jgi:hypothetical protein
MPVREYAERRLVLAKGRPVLPGTVRDDITYVQYNEQEERFACIPA